MSRSNPAKRKPRTTRHTTLIVVEGESEAVLIKHLRNHFGQDAGSRITVKCSSGNGDAVLKMAVSSFEAFDRRVAPYLMPTGSPGKDTFKPPGAEKFRFSPAHHA
ncbi:MAG: hypothetical protein ACKOHM_11960 [Spartobacteria bacterium]